MLLLRRVVVIVVSVWMIAACSNPETRTEPADTSGAESTSADDVGDSSQPVPETPTSSGAALTAVDPNAYDVSEGIKYLFALPNGAGSCWMITGLRPSDSDTATPGAPSISCELPFVSGSPDVFDRMESMVGPPAAAVINDLGAWVSVIGTGHSENAKELPTGSSLSVSHLTCEVTAGPVLRCFAETGEFVFQDGELDVVRDEPSDQKGVGAAARCSDVQLPNGLSLRVYILAGKLSCQKANDVMRKYIAMPRDPGGGSINEQQFDGWTCLSDSIAGAEQSGISKECSAEGQRIVAT